MKVKIFECYHNGENFSKKINDWLSSNEFEVFKILQSECWSEGDDHCLTISVFYRDADK